MRHVLYGRVVVSGLAVFILAMSFQQVAYGDTSHVQNRTDELSTSLPSATANNVVGFSITDTSQPLGSIRLQFCEETPLPNYPCSTPPGLDASAAVLSSQSGNTGFSIGSSTANTVILTRSPSTPTTNANIYELDNIVNPNQQGAYYLRLYIYPTTDGSGPETQNGGVALSTNNALVVSAQVPPYLQFCSGLTITNNNCGTATGYTIDLGALNSHVTSTGTSQFAVGTNAGAGYNVTVEGPTLTSGNNVVTNSTTPTPSLVGSSQFGINLRANSFPAEGSDPSGTGSGQVTTNYDSMNRYMYQEGDTLVSSLANTDSQTFTVSYVTNVDAGQPAGVYVTTLTYICLANF